MNHITKTQQTHRILMLTLCGLLSFLLTACGLKGPLYLPQNSAPAPQPSTTQPQPIPMETDPNLLWYEKQNENVNPALKIPKTNAHIKVGREESGNEDNLAGGEKEGSNINGLLEKEKEKEKKTSSPCLQ